MTHHHPDFENQYPIGIDRESECDEFGDFGDEGAVRFWVDEGLRFCFGYRPEIR